MYNLAHVSEAWRIFLRSLSVKAFGHKRYRGNARQICKQVLRDCWNGRYFRVSAGHFNEFYVRDFGWSVDSLIKLGYIKEVKMTLAYCLRKFSKKRLTTTITPKGDCIDVFTYSVDSLPFLLRSLRVSGSYELIRKYRRFLIKETFRCYKKCFNPKSCLVTTKRWFSSMKDEAKRKSSLNDNIMLAWLSDELNNLNLPNPFRQYDLKQAIYRTFWNGKYFYDDINKFPIVTGDSNVMPFWTGVFNDRFMMQQCIVSIQEAGLDKPFPLKYTNSQFSEQKMNLVENFVGGYERDAIWAHMGLLYIQVVKNIYPELAQYYLSQYTKAIEKYGNFLEVYSPAGKPYKSPFYYADETMVWAANYLALSNEINN